MLKSQLWECSCGREKDDYQDWSDCPACGETACDECMHVCAWCGHEGCEKCMTSTIDGWVCNADCGQKLTAAMDEVDRMWDEIIRDLKAEMEAVKP